VTFITPFNVIVQKPLLSNLYDQGLDFGVAQLFSPASPTLTE